jgi:hypothetical protein
MVMAKNDIHLLDKNGEPYRTVGGNPMLQDQFDGDPSYNPDLNDRTLADVVDELHRQGIPVPDKMLKDYNDRFYTDDNGKAHRSWGGEPMRQDFFEGDPYLDPNVPDLTSEEAAAMFRKLGLSMPDAPPKELNKEGKE